MLIKNNTAKIISTRIGEKKIRLLPGRNDVLPAEWEIVREYDIIKAMLDAVELEEPAAKTPAAAPQVTSLKDFNEREALKLIKETVDADLLILWGDSEQRKGVMAALEKQLKLVDPKVVKTEGDTDADKGAADEEDDADPEDKGE